MLLITRLLFCGSVQYGTSKWLHKRLFCCAHAVATVGLVSGVGVGRRGSRRRARESTLRPRTRTDAPRRQVHSAPRQWKWIFVLTSNNSFVNTSSWSNMGAILCCNLSVYVMKRSFILLDVASAWHPRRRPAFAHENLPSPSYFSQLLNKAHETCFFCFFSLLSSVSLSASRRASVVSAKATA